MKLEIPRKDLHPEWETIFTPEAIDFLYELTEAHLATHSELLADRTRIQAEINAGKFPNFLPETQSIRDGDWKAAPIPTDLQDRRVEITGPVDRKMIINGLNAGTKVYMADCEDSQSPTWESMAQAQVNLYDAVRKTITCKSPEGKEYRLNDNTAVLIVRPRGLHLMEKDVLFNGNPIPGAFFDFAMYVFHNTKESLTRGSGPYFYIPKLENHREARLWASLFRFAEEKLGLKTGIIKATVLIETITAVFEMHEIIYELKDYIVGLNCGRWDYIFSYIKKFHRHAQFVLPNRDQVGMGVHFLKSYSQLLIETCHRRGIHAMGGMAAQIPIKNNEELNQKALEKVRLDKEREVQNGHDGTWVAHPGLVGMVMEIFDKHMPTPNQIDNTPEATKKAAQSISAEDLLKVPAGTITIAGVQGNVAAALHYTAAWISGNGCVPLNHLMEDMATAEIARSQLWQWVHYGAKLDTGEAVTKDIYHAQMEEAMKAVQSGKATKVAQETHYETARVLLDSCIQDDNFLEFLTLAAYPHLQ